MAAIGIGVVCGAGDEWAVVAAGAPAEYDAAESAGAGAETARTCDGRTRRFQRGASEAAGISRSAARTAVHAACSVAGWRTRNNRSASHDSAATATGPTKEERRKARMASGVTAFSSRPSTYRGRRCARRYGGVRWGRPRDGRLTL